MMLILKYWEEENWLNSFYILDHGLRYWWEKINLIDAVS